MPMLRTISPIRLRSLAWLAAALLATAAQGVVISSGDGTGNTTPPADDFGFQNVGFTDTGLSGIYLGDGWVLTLRYDREQDRSDFVVLDANDFCGEPAAVVQLPRRVPIGVHGSWVPD